MLISEISKSLKAQKIIGDGSLEISSLCKIDHGFEGGLGFLASKKYASHLKTTEASAVFITKEFQNEPSNATLIVVKDPYLEFARSIKFFYDLPNSIEKGIHSSAIIEEGAKIG